MSNETTHLVLKGGEFLIKTTAAAELFTPEDLNEEQRLFGDATYDFINARIAPNIEKIDKMEPGLMEQLLNEAGELGILGAGLPEEYGGAGADLLTETLISEKLGHSHSFGVAVAAHTGIGTLPIFYFGTDAQKEKYLPKMASGEIKAAYCLTEPDSGSDALAAKTKAILSADGKNYIINGQKMWITNSGFADLFIVFAQVDGTQFTGFVVEADRKGITLGAEEQKMGIKGSSTRQVFFENVEVPVENVLGEIGKGHKIAFNVLNIGRFKLCAMVMGGSKASCAKAVQYANERQQFKQPIANFGAIQHKLAEQAIRIFACESATYRVADLMKEKVDELLASGVDKAQAKLQAAEEYAIECAALKVLGSETLDYVVDETVQIYGGMGFSEEAPAARAYRDSRINRIFEGTNEINRLLAVDMLLRRAMKGELDLIGPAMKVQQELMAVPDFGGSGSGSLFDEEKKAIANGKKAVLMIAGAAVQKFMQKLSTQQEILMCIADMAIELFAAESTLLRVEKMVAARGEAACAAHIAIAQTYISDMSDRMFIYGKTALAAFAEGDMMRMMQLGLKRFTKYPTYNTIGARRIIAQELIQANNYCF
ncbi:MAG: acyl-CoA dehydrogenase family protein [Sphingobacteriales bacterium]|nr:acyl-CoA dehydrogenase family protein [Sphingobacteriales bacterium]